MDVQVIFFKALCLIRKHRLHEADRNLGGLLHHVTELTGDGELTFALRKHGFNIKNFSADCCPSESGDDTRLSLFLHFSVMKRIHIEIFSQIVLTNRNLLGFSFHKLHGGNTAKGVQTFLQPSYTGFSRVVGNDGLQCFIADFYIFRL